MPFVRPIDREALRQTYRASGPVPFFCIDNFLDPEFARQCLDAFPSFEDAMKVGRSFSAVNEKGKVQVTDSSQFPEPIAQLNRELSSPEFLGLISYVTGIPNLLADEKLVGGGIHQTGPRGHLDVHLDFDVIKDRQLFRRLNILVYFNQGWQPEWGGEFELWDEHVTRRVQTFAPLFNRCVVFETNDVSFHGVSAVRCPPDRTRKSFAAYYYTREFPSYYSGTPRSTVFRAKPDEVVKARILMPAEKLSRSFHNAFNHLKRKVKQKAGRN